MEVLTSHVDLNVSLTDYDGVRLSQNCRTQNAPTVHPPGDMLTWKAMVMIMPAGDNS
jgi:hypothetical protein